MVPKGVPICGFHCACKPAHMQQEGWDNFVRLCVQESNASRKAKWENYMATFGSGGLHRSVRPHLTLHYVQSFYVLLCMCVCMLPAGVEAVDTKAWHSSGVQNQSLEVDYFGHARKPICMFVSVPLSCITVVLLWACIVE